MCERQQTQNVSPLSEAISMIGYEGQLIWNVFNSMIAANSFLVAAFIAVQSLMPEAVLAVKMLPIFGVLVCIIWILITIRMFDYYAYWFAWARHCEQSSFGEKDRILEKGRMFSEGNQVEFGMQTVRLSWWGRLFKNKHLMLSVIGVFIFLYAYFAFKSW